MGDLVAFPTKKKTVPVRQLTKQECDSVLSVLIAKGLGTYLSVLNNGRYVCVFNRSDEPYFIGREESMCYLFDPEDTLLAQSQDLDDVLDVLEDTLKSPPSKSLATKFWIRLSWWQWVSSP